eukprot:1147357-Pelagomonas_calceolata.AAC.7
MATVGLCLKATPAQGESNKPLLQYMATGTKEMIEPPDSRQGSRQRGKNKLKNKLLFHDMVLGTERATHLFFMTWQQAQRK